MCQAAAEPTANQAYGFRRTTIILLTYNTFPTF